MNPYLADILAQPAALREAVDAFNTEKLSPLRSQLQNGTFDRVIISGMGSSFNAAYPAYLNLSQLPLPVHLVNGAELLHSLQLSINPHTLLWLNSQSGRSVEFVNLLTAIAAQPPAVIMTCVNDLASLMARVADICLPIHAGTEATVSTKTYLNMLAVNLLVAEFLLGGDVHQLKAKIGSAADGMQAYLADWQQQIQKLDTLLGKLNNLMILGRGNSLSAVWNGSLINKEAAKCAFEGMHAADFRHGPLELADLGFTALIFAGVAKTKSLNRNLALEIVSHGGQVFWVDQVVDSELPTILIPEVGERVLPLVEILPLQILTLVMAERKGLRAGKFRNVGKVTDRE